MTVDILGVPFAVRLVESAELPRGSSGLCDPGRAVLSVEKGFSEAVTRRLVLHEIIHAIEDALDLELTEEQVVGLAAGLQSIPQLSLELGGK